MLNIGEGRRVPFHCEEWTLKAEGGRVVSRERHVFFDDHGSATVDALTHFMDSRAMQEGHYDPPSW